jgi:hypothetical protein
MRFAFRGDGFEQQSCRSKNSGEEIDRENECVCVTLGPLTCLLLVWSKLQY